MWCFVCNPCQGYITRTKRTKTYQVRLSHGTEKYHESPRSQNQKWLCWQAQQQFTHNWRSLVEDEAPKHINCLGMNKNIAIGPIRRGGVHCTVSRVVRQKNMPMGPVGSTTTTVLTRTSSNLHDRLTEKYGPGSCRTWNQELLCWQVSGDQRKFTRPEQTKTISHKMFESAFTVSS
jgi:hypothetical protein